jgi:hypothetical protein
MPTTYQGTLEGSIGTFTRVTETGDRRVTEDGTVRITEQLAFNSAVGSLIAFGTRVPFSSEPYVNDQSSWKLFVPYIKYNGLWKIPSRIYKKINGNWKRIF